MAFIYTRETALLEDSHCSNCCVVGICLVDCVAIMSTAVEPQNGHLVARSAPGGSKKPDEGALTPPLDKQGSTAR